MGVLSRRDIGFKEMPVHLRPVTGLSPLTSAALKDVYALLNRGLDCGVA